MIEEPAGASTAAAGGGGDEQRRLPANGPGRRAAKPRRPRPATAAAGCGSSAGRGSRAGIRRRRSPLRRPRGSLPTPTARPRRLRRARPRGATRQRRRPDDPGRPTAPPGARPQRRDDRRHRRRRPDHPRGRHRLRREPAHGRPGRPPERSRGARRGAAGRPAAASAPAPADAGRPSPGGRAARRGARNPGEPVDRLPGGRGRSPRPDDPDAQGHRGTDDPRARRCRTPTSRWRSTSAGLVRLRDTPSATTRPAKGLSLSFVPFVVKASRGGAQAQPDLQRPLDRAGTARQAPDQHRHRGRRR